MSSSKVKCTCGWSWDKSNSSKKDMYICHECGRDNSNNMQNGGWLDSYADGGTMQEHQENYNDSNASAPEGMIGDGFSNVGRNYSPAWGGQFQEGGEIPNAQSGRATRADSLDLYNRSLKIDAYYNNLKNKGWYPKREITPTTGLTSKALEEKMKNVDRISKKTYKEQAADKKGEGFLNNTYPNVDPKAANQKALAEHIALTKGTRYATKDNYPQIIDPIAPTTVIDTRIIPKETVVYKDREHVFDEAYFKAHPNMANADYDKLIKIKGDRFVRTVPPSGSIVSLYRYDPLSVKPWDMLTDAEKKARVEKYGTDGVPKSYLNKNKPTTTVKPSTKKPVVNTKKKPLVNPTKLNVEGLQPMSVGLQDVDNGFETNLDIPTPVQRQPKYYNIHDINNQYGGGDTQYRVDSLDELRELPKEQWDRKITPHYQMGGNIYPVNYVPQAQGGMSLPGATGHMYARYEQGGDIDFSYPRTQGIPSKGPHRNQTDVTDASAQNGLEMRYYQNGLDWKPKSISQNGSIVKDDNGYWNPDNWNGPVEIGSNEITMQGVPFDVVGISDEGDIQHMKANNPKNYKYKGKKVTEFRMAQNGLRQEQKGLVNLDQLTNFTNYNTKQPGGWLDTL